MVLFVAASAKTWHIWALKSEVYTAMALRSETGSFHELIGRRFTWQDGGGGGAGGAGHCGGMPAGRAVTQIAFIF